MIYSVRCSKKKIEMKHDLLACGSRISISVAKQKSVITVNSE